MSALPVDIYPVSDYIMREVIFLVRQRALYSFLDNLAPPYLESDWDNSGPQVDLDRETIEKIMIGLDPTLELIQKGVKEGADLLITHHPLIFSELDKLDLGSLTGGKIESLLKNDIGLLAVHTPFDLAARGLSHGLGKTLQLNDLTPLTNPADANLLKLTVFVPEDDEEKVKKGLLKADAGQVGNYRNSYYRTESRGFFAPTESADPDRGTPGRVEETDEIKLEFLLKKERRPEVLSTLKRLHPYEEPGFSIEEIQRNDPEVGLGRVGRWGRSKNPGEIREFLGNRLNMDEEDLKITGNLPEEVTWVAASPGAGGSAVKPAASSRADLLVTGELDYHERLEASERGLVVVEAGHYNSEKVFIPWLKELLREEFSPEDLEIDLYGEAIDL